MADYEIAVNGTPFVVEDEVVTYEQIVRLAFPNGEPTSVAPRAIFDTVTRLMPAASLRSVWVQPCSLRTSAIL